MKRTDFERWLCANCGYAMNAATSMRGPHVPKPGDLSLCFNCAALYVLDDGRWRPPTAQEEAGLDDDMRREIAAHRRVLALAGRPRRTGDYPGS
jgi:hypothetical protein